MGLTKTLINPPSYELGLIVGAKRAFLSVTPPNNFCAYSFDKPVSFVQSDMSDFFVRHRTFFDGVTENTCDCHLVSFKILVPIFFLFRLAVVVLLFGLCSMLVVAGW